MNTDDADLPSLIDLRRMWGTRTYLLAVQCIAQGGQYLIAPQRPLRLLPYQLLQPVGEFGWGIIGGLFILTGVLLALGQSRSRNLGVTGKPRRVHTSTAWWVMSYILGGLLLGFLFIAALLNHGYLSTTLILPLGLCLSEIDFIGRVLSKRKLTRRGRECGS